MCFKQFPDLEEIWPYDHDDTSILAAPDDNMPNVSEVCTSFGLQDVAIEYEEEDFSTFATFKLFQQHIRPMLAKDNPKVSCPCSAAMIEVHLFNNL